ncbi:MAG: hypothetical protein WC718_15565 [Phycisphaerales bacterium]|jgi:SAM-dependent methyltransferase
MMALTRLAGLAASCLFAVTGGLVAHGQPAAQPTTQPTPAPAAAPPATPAPATAAQQPDITDLYPLNIVEKLRMEAGRLLPLARIADAQRFLISTSWLTLPDTRIVWEKPGEAISGREYEALPPDKREGFKKHEFGEKDYYFTRYGSPLAYVRVVDLLASNMPASIPENTRLRNKRILDYGFGGIGHLRLMAALGNDVVGIEVDPVLRALYSDPNDQGVVNGSPMMDDVAPDGSLLLLFGHFPADDNLTRSAGDSYDAIISKNTLKNGYINPEHEVDKRLLVDLGVPNETFVAEVFKRLRPGGLFLMYNLCPAQSKDPAKWIPWADGRSPFSKEMLEKAGFEVLTINTDDSEIARKMAFAMKWNEGPQSMDIENDLFATYTLCRRPAAAMAK